MNRLPLLMTASVSTHGMQGACFSDEERELMYANALGYYIKTLCDNPDQKIVFAENSDWDLDHFKSLLPPFDANQIEFVSAPYSLFDISKGKGYNEMLLINHAVSYSNTIKSIEGGGFFKVTGRYPIYNLDYFLNKASKSILKDGKVLFADIKDHRLYDILKLGWCGHSFECRLFAANTSYYLSNIADSYSECNDYNGSLMEKVLFDLVKHSNDNLSLRFPREPHFGGLEGSNVAALSFSKNQDSLKGKIKRFIGNSIRIFMPWFWF